MKPIRFTPPLRVQAGLTVLAVVAAVVLLGSWMVAPVAAWGSTLVAVYMVLTIALGGLLFVAFEYATGAGWSVVFRRVPETLATTLPILGLAMIGVAAAGADGYVWRHEGDDAGTFWFKELWLTKSFFLTRTVVYVALWSLVAWMVVGVSRKQDRTRDLQQTLTNRRLSGLVLLVFAPTFSLAACDWFMSLEPMWFSTVWGAYHFAGLAMSSLAVIVLFVLYLRRTGPLRGLVRDEHLHDLGKLLFGFSVFWMYLWFSQYMLIWYSNIPEETSYYIPRLQGAWGPLVIASLALNWFIPFFVLLPRPAKRSPVVMARVAVIVLFGRWLDLYLMVFPSTAVEGPLWGTHEAVWAVLARAPEIAAIVLALSVLCLLFFRSLAKASAVPVGDPLLDESLNLGLHLPHGSAGRAPGVTASGDEAPSRAAGG